ncbi:MAG: hypothetical protein WBC87_15290, partial [Pseudolabrys sp.]
EPCKAYAMLVSDHREADHTEKIIGNSEAAISRTAIYDAAIIKTILSCAHIQIIAAPFSLWSS